MRFLLSAAFIAVLAFTGFSGAARADYFVWHDSKSGISLSYPDTWRMISNRQPDEVLTVIAPDTDHDDAVCRVRVRDDKRFLIYPTEAGKDIQAVAYGEDFWNAYLGDYDNVNLYGYIGGAGLGRGYGSFAVTGFDGDANGEHTQRRGIAAAGLYLGKVYIVDCSARAHVFEKWQPQFLSLMASVDFDKVAHENLSGNYRNFFADPRLEFQWPGSKAVTRY